MTAHDAELAALRTPEALARDLNTHPDVIWDIVHELADLNGDARVYAQCIVDSHHLLTQGACDAVEVALLPTPGRQQTRMD